jgi:hypothetical protein
MSPILRAPRSPEVRGRLGSSHPSLLAALYLSVSFRLRNGITCACDYADHIRAAHEGTDTATPRRYWARDYLLNPAGASAPDGDPCTDVDELVRQLNLAANPRKRLLAFPKCRHPKPFTRR